MKKVLNPFRSRNFAAFSSQSYYKTMTRKTIASESLPHKGHTEPLRVQLTYLDPVPPSIRARNAQGINLEIVMSPHGVEYE